MRTLLILHGAQATGKSTFAKELVRKEPGKWKRVNRDSLRLMLDDGAWSPENEKLVVKARDFLIREAIRRGFNVLCDDMNMSAKAFDDICAIAESIGTDITVCEKHFWVELDVAIERDSKRENSVGEKVIRDTWKRFGVKNDKFYKPKSMTFMAKDNVVQKRERDPSLSDAAIIDLDGTLVHIGDRSVYDASKCDEVDILNEPVAETVRLYHNAGYKIIFCSGRNEEDRAPTVRFIEKHLPEVRYELFMRPSGDQRKDSVVKDEIFRREIDGKYNVFCCLDDRQQVVDHYRRVLGLTVFQVNYGDF